MSVLPQADRAIIPIEKFTKYSLSPERDFNKATAFQIALGYTIEDSDMLISEIRRNILNFIATPKGHNGHGKTFECIMSIAGKNGNQANILTSWIIDDGMDFPRLTNCYVTKKKARGCVCC
ncbi:MAG: hypothetical protein FWB71_05955 [Defluviitaleaceae bacterium]|nr:hypothetical protein [Defluviitaleaceae bacterium]